MALSENEKNSHDSYPGVTNSQDDVAQILDERRRAALAEIDNAKFSCVFSFMCLLKKNSMYLADCLD